MTTILVIFILYLSLMIGIGVFFYNKNKNIGDYILGGRSLNPWVAAMSAQASDMSGWLLTGLPGLAFLSVAGTKEAVWTAIGLAIGTYLNWLFVAKRLRAFSEVADNALTIPEFLSNRFGEKKGALKIICACFILLFFLIYTASMFVAGAKLFSTIFGISYLTALLVSGIIIVVYTTLGGFMAVAWTDTVNGVLMFIALLAVPMVLIFGGHLDTAQAMAEVTRGFTDLGPIEGCSTLVITSALAWGLGYFGQPHILPRFMAVQKASFIRPARIIAMVWVLLSMGGALSVGMLGKLYFTNGLADRETVFMQMVGQLFPILLAGVLLSAILAAIMSTADSQLLVTASAFSNDLYAQFKKDATPKQLLLISRAAVVAISAVALLLASNPDNSVFDLVSFAWGGFGAAFGPAILLSLFWRRMTLAGAYAGILTGGIGSVLFYFLKLNANGAGLLAVYEILPAFILSAVVILTVSLLTPVPDAAVLAQFDLAKQKENN